MRKTLTVVAAFVIGFLIVRSVATTAHAPDEKLADHLDSMCAIAERGIKSPDDGVRRLFGYFGENGPQMLHTFGDLLVEIERIDDDGRHDARARLAHKRLRARLVACRATWERFGEAIERDEQAAHRLERGLDRFGRTIEIIFGEAAGGLGEWPLLRRAAWR
jgi:hypothetical protein